MAISEQKNDLCKEFVTYLLGHGGSYVDVFEIELVHIGERIMAHLSPPHQLYHVPIKEYVVILCD